MRNDFAFCQGTCVSEPERCLFFPQVATPNPLCVWSRSGFCFRRVVRILGFPPSGNTWAAGRGSSLGANTRRSENPGLLSPWLTERLSRQSQDPPPPLLQIKAVYLILGHGLRPVAAPTLAIVPGPFYVLGGLLYREQ